MNASLLKHPPESECILLCENGKLLQRLIYGEVYQISEKIMDFLLKNIKRGGCIGLLMTHNIYLPSIILSCIGNKYAFVFLNEDNEQLECTVRDLGIKFILTVNSACKLNDYNMCYKLALYQQDELCLFINSNITKSCYFSNAFCVFLTSGTTGKSKVVQVEKYCIETNVHCLREILAVKPSDVIYYGSQLTFDPSLIELMLALTTGCCLMIVPSVVRVNTMALYKTLFLPDGSQYRGVSILQIVPSLFRRFSVEQQKSILSSDNLRIIAFGGETFPTEILQYDCSDNLRIINLYGITEVSCWAAICEVEKKSSSEVSLGTALAETTIEVRNQLGEPICHGEGEVFIGSSTRKCIVDKESVKEGPVFRATGDIAKVNNNGLFYLGRKNNVIKRFGNRINLNKIETVIFTETNLVNKCVWYPDLRKMIVFILLAETDRTRKEKILDKLHVKLLHVLKKEEYPDSIEIVSKFPLTSHGKLDTRALRSVYLIKKADQPKAASDLFISLCNVYLGLNESQIKFYQELTFFEAGGNSVSAIQLLEEMREVDSIDALTSALFENTLGHCVQILKDISTKTRVTEVKISVKDMEQNAPHQSQSKKRKFEKSMSVKWKCSLQACVDSSPVVFHYRDKVYVAVGSFSNIFTINDALTGHEVSRFVLSRSIENPCLPSTRDSVLYVGCLDGSVSCLDYIQCKVRWKYITGDQVKCKPCYLKDDESLMAFGSYDKHVYALNSTDGTVVWKTYVEESLASNPVLDKTHSRLCIISIIGSCFCIDIVGNILWKYQGKCPTFTSAKYLLADSSIIYSEAKGRIVCLRNNGILKWNFQAGGHVFSSPVVSDDVFVFGCNDGYLYILKTIEENVELQHKICLESAIIATPYVCKVEHTNFAVVACQNGTVNMINVDTGSLVATYKLDGDIFSSPCVYQHLVYFGCRDNYLYCIEIQ